MKIRLAVHGPDSAVAFRSLYRWLRRDGEGLRAAGIAMGEPGAPPGPGEMGGTFEVVQFVFDTVFQSSALALAIASWRGTHSTARSAVTIEGNGRRITLDSAQLLDAESVQRAIRETLGEPHGGARGEEAARGAADGGEDVPSAGDAA
ncbi:hypothetical protein [Streptomyces sp. PSAA01]|uniref:effector-associated constant component EACC1 n=1 Tax=Streptomyces sp. PSAA01 TaxID=2912762 RepID=UPI001F4374D0|nr:hypothetical protein [Streptomyces sp. PSAA01]MCG0291106.1 hypothetical protein [Streptomyces sp. PSAA01]